MPTQTFQVPGISCDHCKSAIESAVGQLDGVESVTVSVDDKTVSVTGDASTPDVAQAIARAGYQVV